MHLSLLLPVLFTLTSARTSPVERDSFSLVGLLDEVILFDAPAFSDPSNPSNTLVAQQAFVYFHQTDIKPIVSGVQAVLNSLGLDIGNSLTNIEERLKLFAVAGLPYKTVKVEVKGCSRQAQLSGTSGLPDLGISLQNVSMGSCIAAKELLARVKLSFLDLRTFNGTIFPSPDSGYGVFSDIDDTVKVSHVLDTLALAKATLIEDPVAVTGMPELYASLATSLSSPQFIYISGSPFQLYPFLHDFISTAFPANKGPILLQNLTVINISQLLEFAGNDGIFEYKLSQIDHIHGMYPNKKFLAIGDSTQKDPETYDAAFNRYGGDFITCIWIRSVDGADNTAARFAGAFAGVSQDKYRIYTDDQILSLQQIDVAGGKC
ncbi:hypothetical protein H2248_008439 [Termitomyces sp. 'cryptogamus']|nr:hypothetical protein H2248_008439 [Termitomyces sp. 'cryptogamus']